MYSNSVEANLLFNCSQRLGLIAAVILHRGTDYATRIGNESGKAQNAMFVHPTLGLVRSWDVSPLENQFCASTNCAI